MTRAIPVAALLFAAAAAPFTEQLELDASVVWSDREPRFGGFSAIAVFEEGERALVLSDRGIWAQAELERNAAGQIERVSTGGLGPLRAIRGGALDGEDADAEGIAVDRMGRVYVSFEGFHRVRRYDTISEAARHVPPHADFAGLQRNSALEALAIDDKGRLYAIPERSGAWTRPFPVYRFDREGWTIAGRLPRDGTFLVVGADFGPDRRLYLLERDFGWLKGFATRIRVFAHRGAEFTEDGTLLETNFGDLDNMEGISVWRDPNGKTRVTLISDDNFNFLQRTRIVEYVLTTA